MTTEQEKVFLKLLLDYCKADRVIPNSPDSFVASELMAFIKQLEKQAAIDALAKTERIQEIELKDKQKENAQSYLNGLGDHYANSIAINYEDQLISQEAQIEDKIESKLEPPIPSAEFDRYLAICSRCGTLSAYLANFIDQMTPDQREIVAIQFDQNLFGTDEAMAKRFRDANNTIHENN